MSSNKGQSGGKHFPHKGFELSSDCKRYVTAMWTLQSVSKAKEKRNGNKLTLKSDLMPLVPGSNCLFACRAVSCFVLVR